MSTYGPADWANKVLHGALTSSAGTLMASDATTDRVKNPDDNFTISIVTTDEAEAEIRDARRQIQNSVDGQLRLTFL